MTTQALILIILLNICHWLGDYTHLSTKKMLAAKRLGTDIDQILIHATIHGWLMAIPLFFYVNNPMVWLLLSFLEIGTHFIIDLLKGRLNGWFPQLQSPANKYHWYVFGADQFLHQFVILLIAYFALT